MDKAFKKFADEILFKPTPTFSFVQITNAKLVEENIFELNFESREVIPFDEMLGFLKALNQNFKFKAKFSFNVVSVVFNEIEIKKYINWIVGDFLGKPHLATVLMGSEIKITDNKFECFLDSSYSVSQTRLLKDKLIEIMNKMGYKGFLFDVHMKETEIDIIAEEKKKEMAKAKRFMSSVQEEEAPVEHVLKKTNGYIKYSIKELQEEDVNASNVLIEAEVFDVDHKKTRTGMIITQLSVTDYEDAIYVKMFAKTDKEIKENSKYEKGDFLSISGNFQIDSYSKQATVIARKIVNRANPFTKRKDDSSRKRVELGARTRMSTMDGIVTPTELLNRAKEWGHKAIAIIDTDSMQSFPEFYNKAKNMDVKAIFGATVNVISKDPKAVVNPIDTPLKDSSYVVFDLETTGLSPIFEDIIEFGAVKISGGQVVDTKQFFIKPSKAISEFTTKLTGIQESDVSDAMSELEGIKQMTEYLGDLPLVAHNANFDITFLNEKLAKNGMEELTNPVIDSMVVARIINPKARRFRLESVASKLNVNYDSKIAHRADYDADVLAKVWLRMIQRLEDMEAPIKTLGELYKYHSPELYEKAFANEVTLIAKNQKGLKELFQIGSKSFTTDFYRGPRVFVESLKDMENILIGSGALKSRIMDRLFYGSKKQVIEEIARYDYIEIQPIQNYAHLIHRGLLESDLRVALKFLVTEARKQNKLVVATGDVRYLDEKDKLYHQVYIAAKGLGGARHYLFRFNESNPVYPTQNFLTTSEMVEQLGYLEDAILAKELVIDNSNKIADMVEDVEVIKSKLYAPKFGDSAKLLSDLAYKTARGIYGEELPEIVEARLKRELEPIIKYEFAVIYWISHLLVAKSLNDGYLVGSRGSVGSSFVATMSKITEVNPLCPHYVCKDCKHSEFLPDSTLNSGFDLPDKMCANCNKPMHKDGQNIPFETFLGFEANKVPDIDLNFSGDYQPIIHNEVKVLFGDTHSFRAGTISTVAQRTAFGYVKGWAEEKGRELSRPFTEYVAKGVAGTKRTTGQHPGGIIVIPGEFDVEDFTPINFPANDKNAVWKTTHFDFHAIHDNVLKLDLLGHVDPTAIKQLENMTGVDAKTIPMSDEKIVSLFSSTEALGITPADINGEKTGAMGIPEFGTRFVRGMLKNAEVTSFGDLIAVSGLSHGTDVWSNNAELLVKSRALKLNEVISCRDDIMVDLIAKGLDPLLAFGIMEKVRKGKGVTPEEEKVMKENDVEDWYIDSLKKIKYMFPKAHATAYVTMAWRIAWFKLYYPAEYYATYFTTRTDVFEIDTIVKGKDAILERLRDLDSRKFVRGPSALTNKEQSLIPIMELATEAIARGVKIGNIDLIKSSAKKWTIDKEKNMLIPPFSVIDGLGDAVAISIINARDNGKFISKEDLTKRTSLNKTSIKKFEELGILDGMDESNQISFDLNF